MSNSVFSVDMTHKQNGGSMEHMGILQDGCKDVWEYPVFVGP